MRVEDSYHGRVSEIEECLGCSVCYTICGQKAIKMAENGDGFYSPVIDENLCIHCGLCLKKCLKNNQSRVDENRIQKTVYMTARDEKERRASCSGGVFFSLAKEILRRNGVVCGCIWDDNFVARHVCAEDLDTVRRMRGSKYVQSDLGDSFSKILKYLREGRTVLFSGTGCQVTALKSLTDSSKLICCAVICGGVPSPKVWRLYKKQLVKEFKSPISKVVMRDKKKGWMIPEFYIEFRNGKKFRDPFLRKNLYGVNFAEGLFINDSCMHCDYRLGNISADIVMGDDWGINYERLIQSKNLGSSAVIVLSKRGKALIESIIPAMQASEAIIEDIKKSHPVLTKYHSENESRKAFLQNVSEENIQELLTEQYLNWEETIKRGKLKKKLISLPIYPYLYNIVWKQTNKRKKENVK